MGFNSWVNNLRFFENLFFSKIYFLTIIYESFKTKPVHTN